MAIDEKTILYLEDNPREREHYGNAMREQNYDLDRTEFISAVSCLNYINPERTPDINSPAAAVLDYLDDNYPIPSQAGPDVIRALRKRWPLLPIIVLSSLSDDQTSLTAIECGAETFITKNLDDDTHFITAKLKAYIKLHIERDAFISQNDGEDNEVFEDENIMDLGRLIYHCNVQPGKFYLRTQAQMQQKDLSGEEIKLKPMATLVLEKLVLSRNRMVRPGEIADFAAMRRQTSARAIRSIDDRLDEARAANDHGEIMKWEERKDDPEIYIKEKIADNVRQQVLNIRRSLKAIDPDYDPITTLPGQGYRFNAPQ